MFMLSFFEIPKTVLHKLDYYRLRFYCHDDNHKKIQACNVELLEYHL
jgi:hypothetical protein